ETRKVLTKERNFGDKLDEILTSRWLGIPIFAVIMWAVFWVSQVGPGVWIAEGYEFENGTVIPGLVTLIEMFGEWVGGFMEEANPFLQTIVLDGIIGGVGAVVGFLPLVMVMYFLLALLEDCGYMSRVAVILDPIFKKVGLSGKSVIPFVVGTGCAVPGIMACRTIRDERERRATAMLAPFIPCGAKIPVIALFAGAFFPESSWVSPAMYFLGIILIFLGALLIKWISGYSYKKSYFIIELPDYKRPTVIGALKSMLSRGWAYIVKAGTVILVCNTLITIMANYSWTLQAVEQDQSILHDIASPIAVLLIPLGFGMWQMAAAAVSGFIAKEEVVGTLAAVFAISEEVINGDFELVTSGGGVEMFGISAVAGLAYLAFNLFTPPCFAAIGAMSSEIKSKKWLFAGLGLQFAVAYTLSFLIYQLGTLFTTSALGEGFIGGLLAVAAIIAAVVILGVRSNIKAKQKYSKK
ncbi:MAG: ferrous iron transporter B, partial [Clostridia bacterium]|nr:ferrous iron transporter B [Clostridia bacterium]